MKSLLPTAVLLLASSVVSPAMSDPAPPLSYDSSLFERPAKVKFVERSAHVDEWQIEHKQGANGRHLSIVVQQSSGGNTKINQGGIEQLFEIFYSEELTEDADQNPQPTLGADGTLNVLDGTLRFASARALAERPKTFAEIGAEIEAGIAPDDSRAARGPEWEECVIFIWHSEDDGYFFAGRFCHISPPDSELMSASAALKEFELLGIELEP